ncbi:hypothetical protein cypCar_00049064 [Cyprinus carpio]|nr:hypothetical protein cypCar_00049064 [Cyprinus carpio]
MCSTPKQKLECELLALLLIYPHSGAELAMQIPQTKVYATLNGLITRQPFAVGGFGSFYIYGFVDAEYRPGMTRQECQEFVINSLAMG